MTLLVVPSGTTTVVATWSVLTELIVVTLIQLFQTFIHIWGGRGVTTGMVTEVVQPRGLLQGWNIPPSPVRKALSLFLNMATQGCTLAPCILHL